MYLLEFFILEFSYPISIYYDKFKAKIYFLLRINQLILLILQSYPQFMDKCEKD